MAKMDFPTPLHEAVLLKRYKRFLADFQLKNGDIITVHCANSGSLRGVLQEGNRVWYSISPNPKRQIPYTWEMVESDETFVGVNTQHPNRLIGEWLRNHMINLSTGYDDIKAEVSHGQSRFDYMLKANGLPDCFLEVKNVHYKVGQGAFFPDAVTIRGLKHIRHLMDLVASGNRAMMAYVVQRNDCDFLSFAKDIDPEYAKACHLASQMGVEFHAYACHMTPQGIYLDRSIDVVF